MPSQITVTAKAGPDKQATALLLTGVTKLEFDIDRRMLFVHKGGEIDEFDLSTVTVTTFTISGLNYTVVVS